MIKDVNKIKRKISFYLRKKIQVKYVLIESDDWGLERAKNEEALESIINKYSKQKITRWTKDALETEEDLDFIFELFQNYKDKFQRPPVITANFITHNIDYSSQDKLKYKPISEGYNFENESLFEKYKEGISRQFFVPQLHGFSHYNTDLLERDFYSDNFAEDLKTGFPLAKSTIREHLSMYRAECFDPAFNVNLERAADTFYKTFGYRSLTFIPPNYLFSNDCNSVLLKNQVQLLQASSHLLSENGNGFINPYFRKRKGLYHSVRNARLDVQADYNYLSDNCISQIEAAFKNEIPAVIDIHRVNFSGRYTPESRLKTIEELDKVLLYLSKNHPDVIFISSNHLIQNLLQIV